jgi:hypothetical protein
MEDASRCITRAPNAYKAIHKFCYGSDHIVVPSTYTDMAKFDGKAFVKIGGESNCDPPQWVPRKYCRENFYKLCANGKKHGVGTRRFERDKCQSFHIGRLATT